MALDPANSSTLATAKKYIKGGRCRIGVLSAFDQVDTKDGLGCVEMAVKAQSKPFIEAKVDRAVYSASIYAKMAETLTLQLVKESRPS